MSLDYIHPELVKRYTRLVKWAWSNSWDIGVSSGSRSYEQQKQWYTLYKMVPPQWPALVANPDGVSGPSPWGWDAHGSLHMLQDDDWSHALDIFWLGPGTKQVHDQAYLYGLRFVNSTEHWHCQWWDFAMGVFPVLEEEDMTLDEYMHGIGRVGEDQGCLKIIDGVIHQKLSDGQWYTMADVQEFIHRHMKHLDEG